MKSVALWEIGFFRIFSFSQQLIYLHLFIKVSLGRNVVSEKNKENEERYKMVPSQKTGIEVGVPKANKSLRVVSKRRKGNRDPHVGYLSNASYYSGLIIAHIHHRTSS